ncbi:TetR/AcrR family transcriptional regulator [Streptomyces sp. ID38640]|uniref:TetR/AcrR family transcriptional regulator n=1 Tax=Streptomyces sp. ID38640 TaxID=1265399 RepID=UPI00140F1FB1|nr:TetR/AcrR family transcriptional regulator [Streptomyces sp. ID38640]QIK07510.1 TetR/AcrR family transcriptional regulator [Streptomyces sp. ID38640]
MDHDEARTRILDAAEKLFYERGIQSVGMDELRTAAGVSLKRLYQCFPAKHDLVEAYLRRRDTRWRAALAEYVDAHAGDPAARPLAVFDWLGDWFTEDGFRGCAFINAYGELGATSDRVGCVAREHKEALLGYVAGLVRAVPVAEPEALARQLVLLIDGAIAGAALVGEPSAARQARTAAAALMEAAGSAAGPGAAHSET